MRIKHIYSVIFIIRNARRNGVERDGVESLVTK